MKLLDLVFPIRCVNCKKGNNWLCANCLEKTTLIRKQKCLYCDRPTLNGQTHQSCKTRYTCERAIAVVPFRYPWREVLHTLKFYRWGPGTKTVIRELLEHWRAETLFEIPKGFLVMPVPLHWARRFDRTYNQAEVIAKTLAKTFELEICRVPMIRIIGTIPQTMFRKEERAENVKGAFAIREGYKKFIKGKSFLLVDDVVTTGATMSEAARTLKKAGAAQVWCFSLARA
jgi:competence protein ComFC